MAKAKVETPGEPFCPLPLTRWVWTTVQSVLTKTPKEVPGRFAKVLKGVV
jgi:hypothetical protein